MSSLPYQFADSILAKLDASQQDIFDIRQDITHIRGDLPTIFPLCDGKTTGNSRTN